VSRDLLRVLTSPPGVRADVIRQFFQRSDGKGMAETLMDLEANDVLRSYVVDLLRDLEEGKLDGHHATKS